MADLASSQHPQQRDRNRGFSLLELLVCVAIIAILLAMYSGVLSKALRTAKGTATAEAMRQEHIAPRSVNNSAPAIDARNAFRKKVDTGKSIAFITELNYVVRDNREFRAYFRGLIDLNNPVEPKFLSSGTLEVMMPSGFTFRLPPMGAEPYSAEGPYPVAWQFISTDITETSDGNIGGKVFYSDGHIKHVNYPGDFPMTPLVAELSHRFMEQNE